jgi:hypothetical protein
MWPNWYQDRTPRRWLGRSSERDRKFYLSFLVCDPDTEYFGKAQRGTSPTLTKFLDRKCLASLPRFRNPHQHLSTSHGGWQVAGKCIWRTYGIPPFTSLALFEVAHLCPNGARTNQPKAERSGTPRSAALGFVSARIARSPVRAEQDVLFRPYRAARGMALLPRAALR